MAARNPPQPPRMVLPWPSPNAASALPTLSSFGEDRKGCACSRARPAERRVAPPRRAARPFASLACSCSASRSCHSGLVQAVVGPAQCGCAKHACCHFARDAASPCPHAWRAGTASAGRPARRVPACAHLPAGPLSRCSLPFSSQVHWDRVRIARKVLGGKKTKKKMSIRSGHSMPFHSFHSIHSCHSFPSYIREPTVELHSSTT